ncbi:hypothetical protein [Pedobacter sp. ASV12]|uniref:hypothetical protein n=1 Tax=Pedobacter sp. ASV12 TaxID=2795120 RepID=UPI0018EA428A|nr:hypothetical protein [Pedobacter sp. ASV12]
MKIYDQYLFLLLLVLCTASLVKAQGSMGANTKPPLTRLHIKPSGTDDPLRLEGVKTGAGPFLVVDDNGVVKTTPARNSFAFVLEPVSNTTGLELSSETGALAYTENSSPTGSLSGGSAWTKIPGMEINFNIIEAVNSLNIKAEGMVQYLGKVMSPGMSVSYAIGVFLDGKLIAARPAVLIGDGFSGTLDKWTILGQANNLSLGSHTIELYATRRSNVAAADAIYIARPATNSASLNQFMAKAVLQVNGVYN